MTPTPAVRSRFNHVLTLSNFSCWKHAVIPSAIFGACIGALESVIKGGAARAIFVTVSFVLFVAMWSRRKVNQ
jgi:hypothetical protein